MNLVVAVIPFYLRLQRTPAPPGSSEDAFEVLVSGGPLFGESRKLPVLGLLERKLERFLRVSVRIVAVVLPIWHRELPGQDREKCHDEGVGDVVSTHRILDDPALPFFPFGGLGAQDLVMQVIAVQVIEVEVGVRGLRKRIEVLVGLTPPVLLIPAALLVLDPERHIRGPFPLLVFELIQLVQDRRVDVEDGQHPAVRVTTGFPNPVWNQITDDVHLRLHGSGVVVKVF